ncbi:transcriptional regulator [Mesorhizobium sp.]|uniref:helix-turn-helix transcriptional regulator n=1 Tax=Mesorhizobium sp. TaxID=1871066 RepID=UPI001215BEBA|nr:transcriptional regulator [Mesorhizobium sp.]TIM48783.1 MAG: transcriptional regulator [Mesorhizobium sp.]
MNRKETSQLANLDAAISIPEFCRRFGISTPTYYKMRAEGQAPREIRMVGAVVRISAEAIRDWVADAEDEVKTADQRAKMKARSEYALSGGR